MLLGAVLGAGPQAEAAAAGSEAGRYGVSESIPVYTSTAEGFRTAEEIAALRPMVPAKPRAPRKATAKATVSSGIVCFCGDRFSDAQALEFMKHLRAELGADLAVLERQRERFRKRYWANPERYREKQRERSARWRANPAAQEKSRERQRLLAEGKVAPQRPRSPEVKERDAKAAKLRERGMSYRQIARELDFSVTAAFEAVQRGTNRQD